MAIDLHDQPKERYINGHNKLLPFVHESTGLLTQPDHLYQRLGLLTQVYRSFHYLDDIPVFETSSDLKEIACCMSLQEVLAVMPREQKETIGYELIESEGVVFRSPKENVDIYIDKQHFISDPFGVLNKDGNVVASARVIPQSYNPTLVNSHIYNNLGTSKLDRENAQQLAQEAYGEFSQVAAAFSREGLAMIPVLLRSIFTHYQDIPNFSLTFNIDNNLMRVINSLFELVIPHNGAIQLAQPVHYLGSTTTTWVIFRDQIVQACKENEHNIDAKDKYLYQFVHQMIRVGNRPDEFGN